jgi:hypothetical protein
MCALLQMQQVCTHCTVWLLQPRRCYEFQSCHHPQHLFLTGRFATIATPPDTGSTSQFGSKLWLAMSISGSRAAGA